MKEIKDISQEKFERIEAFLLGKLPDKEKLDFEEELKDNPDLKREVNTQRKLMDAVETGEMKNRLTLIHQKLYNKQSRNRWLMIAASIAILVSVSIWLITKPDPTDKLFAANLTVEPGLPVPMSATSNYHFYDAMVDYKAGKYGLAISKWETLLQDHPENDTLNYFVGVAFFNKKNYQESIPYFRATAEQPGSSFAGKSEWYLALSFLKLKDFTGLKSLAENSQSSYSNKINQLYKEVK